MSTKQSFLKLEAEKCKGVPTVREKAEAILADFGAWLPRFRAVISDEYLDYLKEAKRHG